MSFLPARSELHHADESHAVERVPLLMALRHTRRERCCEQRLCRRSQPTITFFQEASHLAFLETIA